MRRKYSLFLITVSFLYCYVFAIDDSQTLVGKNWNEIRPIPCQGETMLATEEPLRSYAILTRKGRTLFIYKEGNPIFENPITDEDKKEMVNRKGEYLKILGVIDLENFDWKKEIFSDAYEIHCAYPPAGANTADGIVFAVIDPKRMKKENESFPAKRAWIWNKQKKGFDKISNLFGVTCRFEVMGDGTLESSKEGWQRFGESNYLCVAKDE